MNGWFIFMVIVALAAIIVTVIWLRKRHAYKQSQAALAATPVEEPSNGRDRDRRPGRDSFDYVRTPSYSSGYDDDGFSRKLLGWFSFGLAIATVILLAISSFSIVSTKNVGVVTSFGSPVTTLSNGGHLIAPWQIVTEMDAAIQTDTHIEKQEDCIKVRMAKQFIACIDVSIRWRINEDSALDLFKDYREFESVRTSLVTRELGSVLNSVFSNYDPLATDEGGSLVSVSLNELSNQATDEMQEKVGNQIEVLNVIIAQTHYDENTQNRINALQAQIAETEIAKQAKLTAEAQAAANEILADSVSNDPNVLVSNCFDLLGEMVSKGQVIPTGFSCWPGGGSAIVVPSAAK